MRPPTGPDRPPRAGHLRFTVTFLEMTAPPSRQAPPPAAPLMLTRVEEPPAHFYRYLYRTVGGDYLWTDRLLLGDAALEDLLAQPETRIYLLWHRGAPAGFAELYRRSPQTEELLYFGMMPHAVGRGWGRFFLDRIVALAWDRGPDRIAVQTCTLDHPRALPLYQAAGFVPCGRQIVEKPDPRLSGLLPREAAPHIPIAES